jgi:hypothetical protein
LITYNEHNIQAYNKFYKAQVLQFQTYYGSEIIEIYEVPPPSPDLELWYERIDNVKIHNHEIGFTNDANIGADMVELYSKPNPVYLIYSKISTDMTIKYPDNKISTITLGQEKYYLMVFLKNTEEETEEEESEIFDYQ